VLVPCGGIPVLVRWARRCCRRGPAGAAIPQCSLRCRASNVRRLVFACVLRPVHDSSQPAHPRGRGFGKYLGHRTLFRAATAVAVVKTANVQLKTPCPTTLRPLSRHTYRPRIERGPLFPSFRAPHALQDQWKAGLRYLTASPRLYCFRRELEFAPFLLNRCICGRDARAHLPGSCKPALTNAQDSQSGWEGGWDYLSCLQHAGHAGCISRAEKTLEVSATETDARRASVPARADDLQSCTIDPARDYSSSRRANAPRVDPKFRATAYHDSPNLSMFDAQNRLTRIQIQIDVGPRGRTASTCDSFPTKGSTSSVTRPRRDGVIDSKDARCSQPSISSAAGAGGVATVKGMLYVAAQEAVAASTAVDGQNQKRLPHIRSSTRRI